MCVLYFARLLVRISFDESFSSTMILKYISPSTVSISTLYKSGSSVPYLYVLVSGIEVVISLPLASFATIDALCLIHSFVLYNASALSISFSGSDYQILYPQFSLTLHV